MAGIDKIYGNGDQWWELFEFLAHSQRPQYCGYLYRPPVGEEIGPIANFPFHVDKWLWDECPLPWVRARLKDQYNGAPDRIRKR